MADFLTKTVYTDHNGKEVELNENYLAQEFKEHYQSNHDQSSKKLFKTYGDNVKDQIG